MNLLGIGAPETEAERMRKKLTEAGVTDEDFAAAKESKAGGGLFAPAMQAPKSPAEQAKENYGGLELFGRKLGASFLGGLFADQALPEYSDANKAKYKSDLALYNKDKERQAAMGIAQGYESMLDNDDLSDDLAAVRAAALHQPEVYEPVLREMMQNKYNPAQETFTEGEYQLNPQTDEWEWRMQGNQGTIKANGMGANFIPENRMPTPDYIDGSIGKADERFQSAAEGANQSRAIIDQMDQIGEDGWASGLRGEASEYYKAVTGTEDFVSTVRKNYQDVKVRSGIKNLPPGVASDKDIELALSPWPESTSNFNFIRRKLEAIERIEKGKAEYARFESQYISDNNGRNGLQKAWSQTEAAQGVTTSNKPTRTWEFVD